MENLTNPIDWAEVQELDSMVDCTVTLHVRQDHAIVGTLVKADYPNYKIKEFGDLGFIPYAAIAFYDCKTREISLY